LEIDTEGTLAATESVLDLEQEEDDFVGYSAGEGSTYDKTVYISRNLYTDLGSPQKITVRIVPGDTFNTEES
jgi:hypothetical protein